MEYAQLEQKQNSLLEAISETESNLNVYSGAVSALEKRKALISSDLEQGDNKIASVSRLSENEEYETLKKDRDEKLKKFNSTLVEIASLSAAIDTAKQNEKRLTEEKAEIIEKNEDISANMENIKRNIADYQKMAERAAMSEEEKKAIAQMHTDIEAITKEKQQINERIAKIDDEKLDVTVDMDTFKEDKHKQELELTKLDSDLSALEERITEMYGETYETCLKYKKEDFNVETSQTEINRLKRKISALGEINHTALAEYENLSKRYDGMVIQRDDLQKAIEDLTTALNEVKSEMQNIFDKGFEEINKNFMRTFKELFGGGRAELQLDYEDCDDPLDAGVEIVACPPGKTLKKNSLLSGGEMALTAIAILFAILRSRPMPFVILDEVEAALDESNVGVFADYLKKYSKETQFIVITHRKPTMEKGDTLFGVTMEEKGVSKIVSVKFSEVESRLGADAISTKAE